MGGHGAGAVDVRYHGPTCLTFRRSHTGWPDAAGTLAVFTFGELLTIEAAGTSVHVIKSLDCCGVISHHVALVGSRGCHVRVTNSLPS